MAVPLNVLGNRKLWFVTLEGSTKGRCILPHKSGHLYIANVEDTIELSSSTGRNNDGVTNMTDVNIINRPPLTTYHSVKKPFIRYESLETNGEGVVFESLTRVSLVLLPQSCLLNTVNSSSCY